MVIVNKDLDTMLEEIEFERVVYEGTVEPVTEGLQYLERKGFPYKLFQYAYENAQRHGEDPTFVKIFEGRKGVVVQIRDSGQGFDHQETVRKMRDGERHSTRPDIGGEGLKVFDMEGYEVSFEGVGNVVDIAWKESR
ncbi:MAG: hypothetical protein ACE5J5_08670 [Candidatus Hydrothermarchaeales archaeon]